MDDVVRYGRLSSEKSAEENLVCRQVVREISNFGVTQRQSLMIIYLMALELENIEHMQVITQTIKGLCGELFLTDEETSGPAH